MTPPRRRYEATDTSSFRSSAKRHKSAHGSAEEKGWEDVKSSIEKWVEDVPAGSPEGQDVLECSPKTRDLSGESDLDVHGLREGCAC
jgi:hypothetical protein